MGFRYFLGIDVAKAKLDCMLLDSVQERRRSKVVANTPEGFQVLVKWLAKQGVGCAQVHAILEPTGVYHERALFALTQVGVAVSLVNPAQLRRFAQGLGIHTKTDACDSAVLARFGEMVKPAHWQPAPLKARELQALLARRDAVAQDLQRERNRAEQLVVTDTPERVRKSLAVESQDVLSRKGETRDGRLETDSVVLTVPVIEVSPQGQRRSALL